MGFQSTQPENIRQYAKGDYIGGEYKVEDVFGGVGKSGMGVVYLVSSRDHLQPFVLKTIQGEVNDTQNERYQRFLREAEIWVNLGTHPNIVKADWVRKIDDQLFIAAEYIPPDSEGRNNLRQFIQDGKPSYSQFFQWAIQFCDGMLYAQSQDLLAHRDIKPENLMIAPDGTLKITDFGLARIERLPEIIREGNGFRLDFNSARPVLTQDNAFLGTILYMAPEQFGDWRQPTIVQISILLESLCMN